MTEHMRKGKGVPSREGNYLWLDITILGREHIDKRLREVKEICENFLGIDPAVDYIPVRPTQHYSMGGIRTRHTGESTHLRGLFAAGEAACWDLHGFNRLGGNSVAETVVAGMIVGEYVADYCRDNSVIIDTATIEAFLSAEERKIDILLTREKGENPFQLKTMMQEIMSEKVGIFRNGKDLQVAVDELTELCRRSEEIIVTNKVRHANPELEQAINVPKMLKLALCVAKGALARTESRGAHSREDYPKRNDKEWLKRSLYFLRDNAIKLEYEPIDIMEMELPPGSRGYGEDRTLPSSRYGKNV